MGKVRALPTAAVGVPVGGRGVDVLGHDLGAEHPPRVCGAVGPDGA